MARPPIDEEREHRITYDIIVDCYDKYEVSMGWYSYLLDHLNFPLKAQRATASSSHKASNQKLPKAEVVRIIGMSETDGFETDIFVDIEYDDASQTDVVAIPLSQLQIVKGDDESMQAFEDWQYWIDQGNELAEPDEDEEY
ncbi:calcium-binding protein [cf. Phormidesmis sp. LEGE 11477]|uniref:calcium-binding protein n=1 Tax=cf. Phormidesmis sp. LEGE 11477 TaxID=1828680 RepID=UPI00187FA415|nr:calcium-binding protein [cf. Phormidesmis sp. LEGE 11477]MBE9061952.1 calcium-binding protein [cf. Phormidesmis sp. LEGE 11477]